VSVSHTHICLCNENNCPLFQLCTSKKEATTRSKSLLPHSPWAAQVVWRQWPSYLDIDCSHRHPANATVSSCAMSLQLSLRLSVSICLSMWSVLETASAITLFPPLTFYLIVPIKRPSVLSHSTCQLTHGSTDFVAHCPHSSHTPSTYSSNSSPSNYWYQYWYRYQSKSKVSVS